MSTARPIPTAPVSPASLASPARRRYRVGPLEVDFDGWRASVDGNPIVLTMTEIRLLADLVEHPGVARTRDDFLREIWNYSPGVRTRSPDTHIQRLRGKLGAAAGLIETVRGVGYRLSADHPVLPVA
jgi:DNA-binding response OmpR family regulator